MAQNDSGNWHSEVQSQQEAIERARREAEQKNR
jgi:hypothetical protein